MGIISRMLVFIMILAGLVYLLVGWLKAQPDQPPPPGQPPPLTAPMRDHIRRGVEQTEDVIKVRTERRVMHEAERLDQVRKRAGHELGQAARKAGQRLRSQTSEAADEWRYLFRKADQKISR